MLGLVRTPAADPLSGVISVLSSVKLGHAGRVEMATTLLTACHRCKRTRPRYAKGLCRSCYGLRLYYARQGRPLPPYRARVRRCRGCGEIIRRKGDVYCEDDCRDQTAQRRRLRRAARKLGPWRAWFGALPARERAVLEGRLAGETHRVIGEAHGRTRQYSQQVERSAFRTLRNTARTARVRASEDPPNSMFPA